MNSLSSQSIQPSTPDTPRLTPGKKPRRRPRSAYDTQIRLFLVPFLLGSLILIVLPALITVGVAFTTVSYTHLSGAETVILLNTFYPKLQEIQAHTQIKRVIICRINDFIGFPSNRLVKRAQAKEGQWVDVREGNGVYLMTSLLAKYAATPPRIEVKPDDIALFQYTGGTSGTPKAAMLSHRNLVANVVQCSYWLTDLELGYELSLIHI